MADTETTAPPVTDASEEKPPEKVWLGRPIDYQEVNYGQMRKVRELHKTDPEAALMTLLVASLVYTDDNKKVFPNGMADIEAVPSKWTNLLLAHANQSFVLNLPPANPGASPNS